MDPDPRPGGSDRVPVGRSLADDPLAWAAVAVAHDANNLLAVAVAAVEAIAEALPPGDELQGEAAVALEALGRVGALLLDLGDLTAGLGAPIVLDVAPFVAGLEALLRRVAGAAALRVRSTGEAARVAVDPRHLERILVNLVGNAGRAAGPGGTVTISVARSVIPSRGGAGRSGLPPGRWGVVEVADDGPGMPEVAEPGPAGPPGPPMAPRRVDRDGVHGLGLAIVAGLVARAGGVLAVHADAGGTTVRVALPLAGGEAG